MLIGDSLIEQRLGIVAVALGHCLLELLARGLRAPLRQISAAQPVVRLGEVRLDANGRLQVSLGVAHAVAADEQQRPSVTRLGELVAGCDRAAVGLERPVIVAALLVELALQQERLGVGGALPERLIETGLGGSCLAGRQLGLRQAEIGLGIVGLERDRAAIGGDRVAGVVLPYERLAEPELRLGRVGVARSGVLKMGLRHRPAAFGGVSPPQPDRGSGQRGVLLQRGVIALHRFLRLAPAQGDIAQADQRLGVGIAL